MESKEIETKRHSFISKKENLIWWFSSLLKTFKLLKQEGKSGTWPVLKSPGGYHEASHKETLKPKQLGTFLLMRILSY